MIIARKKKDGVSILSVEGSLDTNTATDLEKELEEQIAQENKKIVVNCEKMDFISSTGLRILLVTAQKLNNNNGELKVCCLNEDVQEVFDITGFSSIIVVSKNEAEALQSFNDND